MKIKCLEPVGAPRAGDCSGSTGDKLPISNGSQRVAGGSLNHPAALDRLGQHSLLPHARRPSPPQGGRRRLLGGGQADPRHRTSALWAGHPVYGPALQEARRIGGSYGQHCARHDISLVDTVPVLFFFRKTFLTATRPAQASSPQYDAEDVRINWPLPHFLGQITCPCLTRYQATSHHLLQPATTL